jgi:hypothetical protein
VEPTGTIAVETPTDPATAIDAALAAYPSNR